MRRRCFASSVAPRVGHRVRPTMCVAGAVRSASLSASAAPGGVRPTTCVAGALLPVSLPASAAACDQQRASPVRCVLHRYGRLPRRLLGVAGHHRSDVTDVIAPIAATTAAHLSGAARRARPRLRPLPRPTPRPRPRRGRNAYVHARTGTCARAHARACAHLHARMRTYFAASLLSLVPMNDQKQTTRATHQSTTSSSG